MGSMQVADDEVYLVMNAGCKDKDVEHISKHLKSFTVLLSLAVIGRLSHYYRCQQACHNPYSSKLRPPKLTVRRQRQGRQQAQCISVTPVKARLAKQAAPTTRTDAPTVLPPASKPRLGPPAPCQAGTLKASSP